MRLVSALILASKKDIHDNNGMLMEAECCICIHYHGTWCVQLDALRLWITVALREEEHAE